MTRRSSVIARSIFRNVSACCASFDVKAYLPIFVTPSTRCATSGPKSPVSFSFVTDESSRTSWRRPAAIDASSSFISARIIATFSGWTRYGSPEERSWFRCSWAETT